MKRVTIEMNIGEVVEKIHLKDLISKIEYIEGLALLRFDSERGLKLALVNIKLKEGYTLNDLQFPPVVRNIKVLEKDGRNYMCIIKVLAGDDKIKGIFRRFGQDFIFEPPSYVDHERGIFSVCLDESEINDFLSAINHLCTVVNIKIADALPSNTSPLMLLTPRQREVLRTAWVKGYYKLPRRITVEELAREMGISKATAAEHLQKAERRLLKGIFEGF